MNPALGPREGFTEEKTSKQVPKRPARQVERGKASQAEERASAKALGQQSGCVVCLTNSLEGQPCPWGRWKEIVLKRWASTGQP